jgi:hypothetical protein
MRQITVISSLADATIRHSGGLRQITAAGR